MPAIEQPTFENLQPEAPAPTPPPAATPPKSEETKTPAAPAKKHLQIAQAYYSSPDFSNVRGTTANVNSARDAFQKSDFQQVIKILEATQPASDDWHTLELLAHAYFLMKRFDRAANLFSKIAQSQALPFSERADWYAALSFFAAGNKNSSETQRLLKKILADEGHPFFEQAKHFQRAIQ